MLLKGYLTVEQVAKQLGLPEYRIHELTREKHIRVVKRSVESETGRFEGVY